MKNKKQLPEEWQDYKHFLKQASKRTCNCNNCKMFKIIIKDFSKKELQSLLRNFIIVHSINPNYQGQGGRSYLG